MTGFSGIVLLLLSIALGFIMVLPDVGTSASTMSKMSNSSTQMTSAFNNLTTTDPLAGTTFFPNVFSLFSGLSNLFVSMFGLVTDVGTGIGALPAPIKLFFITLLIFLLIIKAISWHKGTEGS